MVCSITYFCYKNRWTRFSPLSLKFRLKIKKIVIVNKMLLWLGWRVLSFVSNVFFYFSQYFSHVWVVYWDKVIIFTKKPRRFRAYRSKIRENKPFRKLFISTVFLHTVRFMQNQWKMNEAVKVIVKISNRKCRMLSSKENENNLYVEGYSCWHYGNI